MATTKPIRFHEKMTIVGVLAGLRLRIPEPVFRSRVVNMIP